MKSSDLDRNGTSCWRGGCHCKNYSYEIKNVDAVKNETICHCRICQHVTGAQSVAWFTVSIENFSWLGVAAKSYNSSERGKRYFCDNCGTQLAFIYENSLTDIDITMASLDDPSLVSPKDHIFVSSKIFWENVSDLKQYSNYREE